MTPFPIFSVYQAPFLLKFCRCPITNIYFRSFLHALCYPFSGIMMNIKMNMALAQAAFCMKICEKSLLSISHQYYIPFQAKSIKPLLWATATRYRTIIPFLSYSILCKFKFIHVFGATLLLFINKEFYGLCSAVMLIIAFKLYVFTRDILILKSKKKVRRENTIAEINFSPLIVRSTKLRWFQRIRTIPNTILLF